MHSTRALLHRAVQYRSATSVTVRSQEARRDDDHLEVELEIY